MQYKLKPGAVYDLLMKFINQVGNLRVCSGKTESGILYFNFDKQASSSCFETNLYKRNNIFIAVLQVLSFILWIVFKTV